MSTFTRPRRTRRRIVITLVTIVAVLIAAFVAAEFYVRHNVTSCLSNTLSSELGGPVDVGLSAKPVLLSAVDKDLPYLTVSSSDATFGQPGGTQLKDMQVHAKISNVHLPDQNGRGGSIGSSSATVVWPTSAVQSSLQTLPFGGLISAVKSDKSSGDLQVQFLGGVGALTLHPQITAGRVDIQTVSAEALGIGLPTNVVSQIVDALTGNLSAGYPLGMTPRSVEVTDGGVQIHLAGGQTALQASGNSDQGGGCSLL